MLLVCRLVCLTTLLPAACLPASFLAEHNNNVVVQAACCRPISLTMHLASTRPAMVAQRRSILNLIQMVHVRGAAQWNQMAKTGRQRQRVEIGARTAHTHAGGSKQQLI